MHELGAPAATDVEHSCRAGRPRLSGVEVQFATLRGLEVVRRVRPHRAGVAHGGIQPDLPEVIPDVVVVANCARARAQIRLAHSFTPRWDGPPKANCHQRTRVEYARGASWWLP